MARCTIAASIERAAKMKLCVLVLAAACCLPPARSQAAAAPQCYQVVNVDLWDVLYIRSGRTHLSVAVGAIAPDHTGIVRATGACQPVGANRKRQWCAIDYYPLPNVKISGFVKAYFIEAAKCPAG